MEEKREFWVTYKAIKMMREIGKSQLHTLYYICMILTGGGGGGGGGGWQSTRESTHITKL